MVRKRTQQTPSADAGDVMEAEPVVEQQPGDGSEGRTYEPGPNPRSWAHNNQVGVQLQTRREPYQAELVFKEKPPQEVIDYIKEQGFRWNGPNKLWVRPENYTTQAQDRLVSNRTYHKVVDMLREAKGLAAESERTPF